MSIDDIKKKAKLSLSEMYDNQSVGNLDNQKTGHPADKTVISKSITSDNQPINRTSEKLNCKITFNTTERLLDAFNEIYARRIIEKRKTDKSALLNEALELLIEKEGIS